MMRGKLTYDSKAKLDSSEEKHKTIYEDSS